MADTGSSDTTLATKRRRVDGTDELAAATGPTERYKDLWLDDGNIILQCGQGAFCVHRSLLAAQSEVFRDMFTLPSSAGGAEDAIPTVQLNDDTDQMYKFLRCLMLHEYPAKNSREYTDQILDILELSRKYAIPSMRIFCVDFLKELFPETLVDYQHTMQKRFTLVSFRASLRCVMAANAHGLPTILPACYVFIAARYNSQILDIDELTAWPTDVPLTVYATVVRMMRQISHVRRDIDESFSSGWEDIWLKRRHGHDTAALLTYYRGPHNRGNYPDDDLLLFDPEWKATDVVGDYTTEALCDECVSRWNKKQTEEWALAWDGLPRYLRLESWETLRQQESQASSTV